MSILMKKLLTDSFLVMNMYPRYLSLNLKYLSSSADHYQKFLDLCNQWPADTCDRKLTLVEEIRRRVTNSLVSSNKDHVSCEAEYKSLLRILNNHHRDNYPLPSGLGQSKLGSGAPQIAATGADLDECRRILANQNDYVKKKKSLLSRLFPMAFG